MEAQKGKPKTKIKAQKEKAETKMKAPIRKSENKMEMQKGKSITKLKAQKGTAEMKMEAQKTKEETKMEVQKTKKETEMEAQQKTKAETEFEAQKTQAETEIEAQKTKAETGIEAQKTKAEPEIEAQKTKSGIMMEAQKGKEETEMEAQKGKAERFWDAYRRVSSFPSKSTNATEQKAGIIFYVICFGTAILLIAWMFMGKTHTYVDYHTSGGEYQPSKPIQTPDIVACPSTRTNTSRNYTVWYDEDMIQDINITDQDINFVAQQFFSRCEHGKQCPELSESCSSYTRMRPYCDVLDEKVARALNVSKKSKHLRKIQVIQHFSGKLHMLWIAIISDRYADVQQVHKSLFPDRKESRYNARLIYRFLDGSEDDVQQGLKAEAHERNAWFDTRFCVYVLGREMGLNKSPFFGLQNNPAREPFIYWIGNLETTKLSLEKFTTNYDDERSPLTKGFDFLPRVAAVVLYNTIAVTDHTTGRGTGKECVEQPLTKGLRFCQPPPRNETRWHYDLSFQKRMVEKVWIYPQTLHIIQQFPSFTAYTQFQLGGGLLSSFVGFSFLQVLELGLSLVRKKTRRLSPTAMGRIQMAALAITILITISLTGFDLYSYFSTRYATVFTEKPSNAVIPILQFCTDIHPGFGFINTSKLNQYGAPVDFYSFLRYAGWHLTPFINIAYRELKKNNSIVGFETPKWMRRHWFPKVSNITSCINWRQKWAYDSKMFYRFMNVAELCPEDYVPWVKYVVPPKYVPKIRPINLTQHVWFMDRMGKQIEAMAVKMGKPDAKIVDFLEFFALDPQISLRCEVSGKVVPDCGKFARYFFGMRHEVCLRLHIPPQPAKASSVRISYDGELYKLHSDLSSYYGPGLYFNNIKHRQPRYSTCKFFSPRIIGWQRSFCPFGRSWSLKAVNPDWGMNYVNIQHDYQGPMAYHAHSVRVQSRFSSRIRDCLAPDELMCRFPDEEVPAVFKALQYEIWCGCSFCASTKDAAFFASMEHILGRKVECCDGKTYLSCLTRYLEKAKLREETNKLVRIEDIFVDDDNSYVVRNFAFFPREFSDPRLLAVFTKKELPDRLHRVRELDEDVRSRLVDYVRKCFTRPCNEQAFNVISYQDDPIEDPVVNFTLVIDPDGVGTQEIDRLDPAQLLGTLFASLGLIIGIGGIGIVEVIISKMKVSKIVQQHLLRGLGRMLRKSEVEPDTGNTEKEGVTVGKTGDSDQLEIPEKEENPRKHKILLIALLMLSLCMLGLLVYFFCTLDNQEYGSELSVSPSYEKPSVALCVESRTKAQQLMNALAQGTCTLNDGSEQLCDTVFKEYVHAQQDRFCFLLDNSGTQHRMDQDKSDLNMEVPRDGMPTVGLIVKGLNNSSPGDLHPKQVWGDEDISITYTVNLHHIESGKCSSELKAEDCPKCGESFMDGSLRKCCLRPQKTPGFHGETTCDQFKYIVAMKTETPSKLKTKRLSLAVSTDNMIIYSVNAKYGLPVVLSMVGGFVGSFSEITVLSLAGLFGFILWNEVVGLWVRRQQR